MIYLLTIIMSEKKKKKHNAKQPKTAASKSKIRIFCPKLCVFQTSYVQSLKKICVEIWIIPC